MRKIVLIAALLLFCISGAALAQEATPAATPMFNFCGTLSEADCAILQKAQDSVKSLDSESYALDLNATVTNVPDMTEPIKFSMTANGSFSGASSIKSDMTLMQSDPGQYLVNALDNLDADLTLTINLPPEATAADPTIPSSITFQGRLVDGVGYVNTDTLKTLMGSSASSIKGWYGLDLANFLKAAMQQMPQMFNMMNMSSTNPAMMQQYEQMFTNPDMLNRFLKIERTDDGSTNVATFQMTIDLGALMGSPQFQDLMRQQMQAQMQMQGTTMSQQEMDQAMAMTSQMLKGMSIVLNEEIGTDDGYLHSVSGTFAFDTAGMMTSINSMSGTTGSAATPEAEPNINVDFTIKYSNFNDAPTISAPPNPVVIPYQTLLSGMSSELGTMGSELNATAMPPEPMATAEASS